MQNQYDFTTLVPRLKDSSNKWLLMHERDPQVSDDIAPFSVADADIKTAPEIVEGLKQYIDHMVFGYTRTLPSYTKAVCEWNKRYHQWEIEPEWIVTSPGVVPALYTAVETYTKPGDEVAILTPVYPPFYEAIRAQKRIICEVPLLDTYPTYQIDFVALENTLKSERVKLLIFCSPHNPIGRVWTKEELEKVAEICLKHHVLVVSDEIHYDIVSPGHSHTVFATISKEIEQHCIICTAPSKSFNIAGLQSSSIIIPNEELRKAFIQTQFSHGNGPTNPVGMKACEIAYTQARPWLNDFLTLIETNSQWVENFIHTHLPKIRVYERQGTFLLWLDFSAYGLTSKELDQKLVHEAQWFTSPGSAFGQTGTACVRFNLACPTQTLQEAFKRLEKVFVS